ELYERSRSDTRMFLPRVTSAGKAVRRIPAVTQDAQARDAIETIRDRNRPKNCVRQGRLRAHRATRREAVCECRNAARAETPIRPVRPSRAPLATPAGPSVVLHSSLPGEILPLSFLFFSDRWLFFRKLSSRLQIASDDLHISLYPPPIHGKNRAFSSP